MGMQVGRSNRANSLLGSIKQDACRDRIRIRQRRLIMRNRKELRSCGIDVTMWLLTVQCPTYRHPSQQLMHRPGFRIRDQSR